eukprot:s144_g36.t1
MGAAVRPRGQVEADYNAVMAEEQEVQAAYNRVMAENEHLRSSHNAVLTQNQQLETNNAKVLRHTQELTAWGKAFKDMGLKKQCVQQPNGDNREARFSGKACATDLG